MNAGVAAVLATGALGAAVAAAAPANTVPPSLIVRPGTGSHVTVTQGSWAGLPTSFTYQYLRCPDGGGAANGSNCTAVGPATTTPELHIVQHADSGHTLRVRVTAANGAGSTSAISAASGTAFDSDINVLGCPPVQQAGANIDELRPPAQLQIDRHTSDPAVITSSTQVITLRVEVVACDDQYVRGALVYATPTPFQMFSETEGPTDATGWATLTLRRLRHFPASPRQQTFVIFLRARRAGDPLLGGISGRRLIALPVRLR